MVTEKEVLSIIDSLKENRSRTMAEFIAEVYKDKFVEIYLGDTYEDISTEQVSTSYPAVFCCKVISAFKECLVLQPIYVGKDKNVKSSGLLFISERAIRALSEIDNEMVLQDMILRSGDALSVYNAYIGRSKQKFIKR